MPPSHTHGDLWRAAGPSGAAPIQAGAVSARREEDPLNSSMPVPVSDAAEQTLRMGVENIGFMLERLGRDCD